MFLVRLMQTHFNAEKGQKYIFALEHQLYLFTRMISLKGNIQHKKNKIDSKQSLSRNLHLFRCTINNKLFIYKRQKNENHFQNRKRRVKNTLLQITK